MASLLRGCGYALHNGDVQPRDRLFLPSISMDSLHFTPTHPDEEHSDCNAHSTYAHMSIHPRLRLSLVR